jgi:hypothetical protein
MGLTYVGWNTMGWIQITKVRDNYRALENLVIASGFHKMWGIN